MFRTGLSYSKVKKAIHAVGVYDAEEYLHGGKPLPPTLEKQAVKEVEKEVPVDRRLRCLIGKI